MIFHMLTILQNIDLEVVFINAMVLVWIGTVYAAFTGGFLKNSILEKVLLSFFFSVIVVGLMTIPFEISEGYIFDARTILLSLAGLFLGFIPTVFIMIVAILYRIYLGSSGVFLGILFIVFSGMFGLLWRGYISRRINFRKVFELLIFSIISGVIPFVLIIIIEYELFIEFWLFFVLFCLVASPLLTFILALIIEQQDKSANLSNIIIEQKKLLQASIDSPKVMEIYVLDKDFNYLAFNSYHNYCMSLFYGAEIKVGDSFLEHIKNSKMYSRFRSQISKALQGIEYTTVDEVETTKDKYYESMFTPIRDDDNEVIGVGIFAYDVTKKKQYEKNLEYLNYHDTLTDVYNRRYYNEKLLKYDALEYFPLCILLGDVDSLKTINDAFGHEKGDETLIETASVLKNVVQDKGFVSRIGGDEFVAVLKNVNAQMAENIIEEIFNQLGKISVAGVRLSMSVGYDIIDESNPISEAFKTAEANMYKNKLFEQTGANNETINTIMKSLYEKNPREESHSQRVSKYCVMVGEELNLSKDKVNSLRVAGMLHDIGKIAISDSILDKPDKLTEHEYERIKKHPEIGYRILSTSSQYIEVAKDVLHHHEHYNGKGYPRGLVGEDIPVNSRIISIVDAYDAMTLSRPYRASLTKEGALKEISDCSGTQFDPDIAKVFIEIMNQ
ncbi:MAG: diguanylate cyclase [Tenericutes bacterium]|jgi:diguanylate cyclase (GGDEF)-like protein|nr:diguanylate cyclase [Mycoplasmatota bacterium]